MIYICDMCQKEFPSRQNRYRHMKNHCHLRNKDVNTNKNPNPLESALIPAEPTLPKLETVDDSKKVENVTINYVLPKQNYWEMLKEKMGTPNALQFLHRCADLKMGGDILLFEQLFMPSNNRASWPIDRKKGTKELILKEPDGSIVEEYAGKVVYERFIVNYKDALVLGSNQILSILIEPEKVERELKKEKETQKKIEIRGKVKDIHPDDLESAYTSIFTEYDFGKFQSRAYEIQHEHPKPHGKFSAGMIESNFT